ncbi:hypothetical protein ACIOC1_35250 [Streptomyces sp. NPDC088197]|uniref:hypothetical protein n=1 Tax=unclassified Streptomyces TaxID=2593676 RepID=UPI0036DFCB0F
MNEATRRQGATVWDPATDGGTAGHGMGDRPKGPHNIQNHSEEFDQSVRDAETEAATADRARFHGVSVRLLESGTAVHDMIQALFNRETTAPADLRPVADAFRRHCAAKDATAGRALESHPPVAEAVRRDREEGAYLLALLDGSIASPGPAGTRAQTVNGVLADIDQFLGHEQRDFIPLIERELPVSQSNRLAASFDG